MAFHVFILTLWSILVLSVPAIGGNLAGSTWMTYVFSNVTEVYYYTSIKTKSHINCVAYCRNIDECYMITLQDGICYCLKATNVPVVFGESTVNTTSIFENYIGFGECLAKAYTYFYHPRLCLKANYPPQSIYEANATCQADGGYMLQVETQTKLDVVTGLLLSLGIEIAYIGSYRVPGGQTFYWNRGGVAEHNLWWPGEPNNHHGMEDCVDVTVHDNMFKLNDIACNLIIPFVCEILI